MRYALSLLLLPALASPALAQDNDAEKLFRDMEKKILSAKSSEVTVTYRIEKKKTKATLLVTNDNKARLKISGHFADQRKATFELVADGKRLRTMGAKMFVASNGQPAVESGGQSEWETPRNFHRLLGTLVSRGGMGFTVLVMPYLRAEETENAPENMRIKVYDFKMVAAEKVGGRDAKAIRYKFGEGKGCRDDEEITLWIDAKSLLPLKRTFVLRFEGVRISETYSEFKLDPKIDAEAFELPATKTKETPAESFVPAVMANESEPQLKLRATLTGARPSANRPILHSIVHSVIESRSLMNIRLPAMMG
jgi:outer membrane lipoprotein-sorting protein